MGADTAVCAAAGLGTAAACADALGWMQDLGGVSVNTPWGGGSIKWKRVNYDLGSF